MNQKIAKVSVSLSNKDRQLVAYLADEKGLNFSSALRVIIREWAQGKGHVQDEKTQRSDVQPTRVQVK